mmetsp:Transcript_67559/g.163344  ORF Transcript_67559/g.163344 Transcript_67559/m.163344 type:complete len:344 (-) Transcript_67559:1638-2669(-)
MMVLNSLRSTSPSPSVSATLNISLTIDSSISAPYTFVMCAFISFAEILPLESASTPLKAFSSPPSLLSMLAPKTDWKAAAPPRVFSVASSAPLLTSPTLVAAPFAPSRAAPPPFLARSVAPPTAPPTRFVAPPMPPLMPPIKPPSGLASGPARMMATNSVSEISPSPSVSAALSISVVIDSSIAPPYTAAMCALISAAEMLPLESTSTFLKALASPSSLLSTVEAKTCWKAALPPSVFSVASSAPLPTSPTFLAPSFAPSTPFLARSIDPPMPPLIRSAPPPMPPLRPPTSPPPSSFGLTSGPARMMVLNSSSETSPSPSASAALSICVIVSSSIVPSNMETM